MHAWPNGAPHPVAADTIDQHNAHHSNDGTHGDDEEHVEQLGSVRIAHRVLRTVVEQAALRVRGIARMAHAPVGWPQLGRSRPLHGVSLLVHGDAVAVDLYLIVEPGSSMVQVGTEVQEAVGAAVEHILGMGVSEINVYIQDVA